MWPSKRDSRYFSSKLQTIINLLVSTLHAKSSSCRKARGKKIQKNCYLKWSSGQCHDEYHLVVQKNDLFMGQETLGREHSCVL
jgi:hypothetical protein